MRLAAQAKMGFYPAHPDAIAAIAAHLRLADPPRAGSRRTFQIIDPCCGQGAAIQQLGSLLGVPEADIYGIELDEARAEAARQAMPAAQILGPASIAGVRVTPWSFGLAYVNPPFDDELGGGGREEQMFVREATRFLEDGGILVLVLPSTAIINNRTFCEYLDATYESIRIFTFPRHVRPYKEMVIIGRKRKIPLNASDARSQGDLHAMGLSWRSFGWDNALGPIDGRRYVHPSPHSNKLHVVETPHIVYSIPGRVSDQHVPPVVVHRRPA